MRGKDVQNIIPYKKNEIIVSAKSNEAVSLMNSKGGEQINKFKQQKDEKMGTSYKIMQTQRIDGRDVLKIPYVLVRDEYNIGIVNFD